MKYEEKHLQPFDRPLIGFRGGRVLPIGTIVLLVRVDEKKKGQNLVVNFTVLVLKFSYNAIMGLPLIYKIKAIISTHQLFLQYEWDNASVGILRNEQKSTRECLINTLKNGELVQECRQKRKLEEASVLNIQTSPQRPKPADISVIAR